MKTKKHKKHKKHKTPLYNVKETRLIYSVPNEIPVKTCNLRDNIIYELIEEDSDNELLPIILTTSLQTDTVCREEHGPTIIAVQMEESVALALALEEAVLEDEEALDEALEEEDEEDEALDEEALDEALEEEAVEEEEALDEEAVEDEALEEAVEEEEEAEVYEIIIKGTTYYTTDELNGIIYEVDKNGDVGNEIGSFKNGKATIG